MADISPYNFGLSLALAVVAIASTVTNSLDGIVTREIVKSPSERDVIIDRTFIKKFCSITFACATLVVCFFSTMRFSADRHPFYQSVFQAFDE